MDYLSEILHFISSVEDDVKNAQTKAHIWNERIRRQPSILSDVITKSKKTLYTEIEKATNEYQDILTKLENEVDAEFFSLGTEPYCARLDDQVAWVQYNNLQKNCDEQYTARILKLQNEHVARVSVARSELEREKICLNSDAQELEKGIWRKYNENNEMVQLIARCKNLLKNDPLYGEEPAQMYDTVTLGFYLLKAGNSELRVPVATSMYDASLILSSSNNNYADTTFYLVSYLCRVLCTQDMSDVKISLVDICDSGKRYNILYAMGEKMQDLFDMSHDCYSPQDVKALITFLQNELQARRKIIHTKTFEEYKQCKTDTLPLRIIVIDHYAKVFTKDIDILKSLYQTGSQYGIYFILIGEPSSELAVDQYNRENENFRAILEWGESNRHIEISSGQTTLQMSNKEGLSFHESIGIDETSVAVLLKLIERKYYEATESHDSKESQFGTNISALVEDYDYSDITREELCFPIGISMTKGKYNMPISLTFSGPNAHGILSGSTRVGKSTLFHHMLIGAMSRYSPDEFQVYILDLKEGMGFQTYSKYILPCVAGVVTTKKPVDSLLVLEELEQEMTSRGALFGEYSVSNISEYRDVSDKNMPQILLLVDEYPVILSATGRENERARSILLGLINRGAAGGIHVMLCSQNVSMSTGLSKDMLEELKIRLLVQSNPRAIETMLNGSDNAALKNEIDAIRKIPIGQGVVNYERGDIEYNQYFVFENVTRELLLQHLKRISDHWDSLGYTHKPKIIGGDPPAYHELVESYSFLLPQIKLTEIPVVQIGEYLSLRKPYIRFNFDGASNNNALISTTSSKKANSIIISYLLCLEKMIEFGVNVSVLFIDFSGVAQNSMAIRDNFYYAAIGDDALTKLPEKLNNAEEKYVFFYGLHLAGEIWDSVAPKEPAKTIRQRILDILQQNTKMKRGCILWGSKFSIAYQKQFIDNTYLLFSDDAILFRDTLVGQDNNEKTIYYKNKNTGEAAQRILLYQ